MAFPISQMNKETVLKRVAAVCQDAFKDVENNDKNDDKDKQMLLLVKNPPLVKGVRKQSCTSSSNGSCSRRWPFSKETSKLLTSRSATRSDLGLDREYNKDKDNPDVGWGQTRAPRRGDLD